MPNHTIEIDSEQHAEQVWAAQKLVRAIGSGDLDGQHLLVLAADLARAMRLDEDPIGMVRDAVNRRM